MADWHGYPQHPDAHPERPWWRAISAMRWQRSDGQISRGVWPDTLDDDEADAIHTRAITDELTRHDTAHPLPPPEPRCGQVWVDLRHKYPAHNEVSHAQRIDWPTGVVVWRVTYADLTCPRSPEWEGTERAWPPPGAVLVAGPGAPWAPMGGE